MGNAEKCPCGIVNQIFTSPDEVINFGHVTKANELGASEECVNYLFDNIGKTAKEAFPTCFEATLVFQTSPAGVNVYVDDKFVGTT